MHRVTKAVVWTLAGIGVLAIVAGVLMPVFSTSRAKARRVGEMAEMRMAAPPAEYEYASGEVADAARSAALPSVLITSTC